MKIISGGQTGADVAGLMVGKMFGLETGGTMPRGFLTLDGCRPEYAVVYGMTEHVSEKYPPRTEENVKNSDGTLRFAKDFTSAGERCTLKYIKRHNKPHFDASMFDPDPDAFALWLKENKVQVLNVAGNSERTAPGIENMAVKFLIKALLAYGLPLSISAENLLYRMGLDKTHSIRLNGEKVDKIVISRG